MNGLGKILAACDFGDSNEIIVRSASMLAEKHEAELHLLHVLSKKEQNGRSEETIRHTKERLERLLSPEQVMKLSCHWEAVEGSIAKQITHYARDNAIDLIVLGARNRTGLVRFIGHGVASDVLKTAPCSTMVVPLVHALNPLSLAQVAVALHNEFGESLAGDRETTRMQMRQMLKHRFELSDNSAAMLLGQLQLAEVLIYGEHDRATDSETLNATSGSWRIRPQMARDTEQQQLLPQFEHVVDTTPTSDLLHRAQSLRATDIHIDPIGGEYRVRMRIDGHLGHYCDLDADLAAPPAPAVQITCQPGHSGTVPAPRRSCAFTELQLGFPSPHHHVTRRGRGVRLPPFADAGHDVSSARRPRPDSHDAGRHRHNAAPR